MPVRSCLRPMFKKLTAGSTTGVSALLTRGRGSEPSTSTVARTPAHDRLRETTTFTGPSPVAPETPPISVSFRRPPALDQDHASTMRGSSDAVKTTDRPLLVTSLTCKPAGVTRSSPTCNRQVPASATAHNSWPVSSQAGTPAGQSTHSVSLASRMSDVLTVAAPTSPGRSTASTAHALWSRCSTNSKGPPQLPQCTATR